MLQSIKYGYNRAQCECIPPVKDAGDIFCCFFKAGLRFRCLVSLPSGQRHTSDPGCLFNQERAEEITATDSERSPEGATREGQAGPDAAARAQR